MFAKNRRTWWPKVTSPGEWEAMASVIRKIRDAGFMDGGFEMQSRADTHCCHRSFQMEGTSKIKGWR
jgi:hypothetical protein